MSTLKERIAYAANNVGWGKSTLRGVINGKGGNINTSGIPDFIDLITAVENLPVQAEVTFNQFDSAAIDKDHYVTLSPSENSKVAISGFSATGLSGKVYVTGGVYNGSDQNVVQEFNPITGTWALKADLPTATSQHTSTDIGSYLLVIGYNTCRMYYPPANLWSETNLNLPQNPRYLSAAAGHGESQAYLFGGSSGKNGTGTLYNKTDMYDFVTGTWSSKTAMGTARYQLTAVKGNDGTKDRIYVMGGNNTTVNEAYDPELNTWSTKASLPFTASKCDGAAANGKIYVSETKEEMGYSGYMYEYSPADDQWKKRGGIPYMTNLGSSSKWTIAGDMMYCIHRVKNVADEYAYITYSAYSPLTFCLAPVTPGSYVSLDCPWSVASQRVIGSGTVESTVKGMVITEKKQVTGYIQFKPGAAN